MRAVLAVVSSLVVAGCSVIGVRSGTEEPKYSVVSKLGDVEIRQYGPRIAAEATVMGAEYAARSDGFRKVAAYIFGANQSQSKIAMTAPVSQAPSSEKIAMTVPVSQVAAGAGAWTIRFYMPANYTLATLPKPTDPDVKLVEVPGRMMAVQRFSGFASPEAVEHNEVLLLAALRGSTWQQDGEPVAWFYDPPWALPFVRRNEVAVPVVGKS